jgi:hypothetical protein
MSTKQTTQIDLSPVKQRLAATTSFEPSAIHETHDVSHGTEIHWPPLERLTEQSIIPSLTAANHTVEISVETANSSRTVVSYCFAVSRQHGYAYLHDLWVQQPLRQQGLGEALRASVLDALAEQVTTIYSRPISPGGLALAEKQGFKPVDHPHLDGGWYANSTATDEYLDTVR